MRLKTINGAILNAYPVMHPVFRTLKTPIEWDPMFTVTTRTGKCLFMSASIPACLKFMNTWYALKNAHVYSQSFLDQAKDEIEEKMRDYKNEKDLLHGEKWQWVL